MKKELLLKEDEAAQQADTPENPVALTTQNQLSRPAKDSVDDQIDALLLRYEKSSVREKSAISIDESLKSLNLKFLIEQEEEADEIFEYIANYNFLSWEVGLTRNLAQKELDS